MNKDDYIQKLEAENFALREAAGLDDENWVKPEWKLTLSERRLFSHLVAHPCPTFETAFYALYWDKHFDNKETLTTKVLIHKMRKKLEAFGIKIRTLWGIGWQIEESQRNELLKIKSEYKSQIPA